MTRDPIETLSAADPFGDAVPTAAESARMDAELHRLLALATAEETQAPATAAAPRDVVAAQDTVGPRGPLARRRARRAAGSGDIASRRAAGSGDIASRRAAGSGDIASRRAAGFGDIASRRAAGFGAAGSRRAAGPRGIALSASRWLALPAIAVAATVVALAAPDRAPQPLRPAPATAATVLAQLGGKVAQAPAPAGRYAYEKQLSYVSHMRPKPGGKGTFVVVLQHTDEQWIPDEGAAITRNRIAWDQPTFPTPEDKADYEAAGTDRPLWDDSPHRVEGVTVAGFTPTEVRALPTDPVALRERLIDPHVQMTAIIGQLLGSALTPQPVKVALFEVLKGLPGATLVPGTTDPKGRTGVGVRFESDAWNTLFLFNPSTGELLGTRSIGHKEVPGRDIDDWSLVLESHRVDDAPAPTGRTLTIPVA